MNTQDIAIDAINLLALTINNQEKLIADVFAILVDLDIAELPDEQVMKINKWLGEVEGDEQ